jgi:hypothetical protein
MYSKIPNINCFDKKRLKLERQPSTLTEPKMNDLYLKYTENSIFSVSSHLQIKVNSNSAKEIVTSHYKIGTEVTVPPKDEVKNICLLNPAIFGSRLQSTEPETKS